MHRLTKRTAIGTDMTITIGVPGFPGVTRAPAIQSYQKLFRAPLRGAEHKRAQSRTIVKYPV
eukprot:3651561-Amphidinium_carterae.1